MTLGFVTQMPELHAGLYHVSKLQRLYYVFTQMMYFRNRFHYCTTTVAPEGLNKTLDNRHKASFFGKVHACEQSLLCLQKNPSANLWKPSASHARLPILQRNLSICGDAAVQTHIHRNVLMKSLLRTCITT